jgi:hypothetical protein
METKTNQMKHTFLSLGVTAAILCASCGDSSTSSSTTSTQSAVDTGVSSSENTSGSSGTNSVSNGVRYVNLNTGQNFQPKFDTANYITMDMMSGDPVQIYVDTETKDTFHTSGVVVNNALLHTDAGWAIDPAKIKVDGDKIKIKDGDLKIKINGDKMKVKDGDSKTKMEGNDSKTKTDDIKIKQEDGEIKVKDK